MAHSALHRGSRRTGPRGLLVLALLGIALLSRPSPLSGQVAPTDPGLATTWKFSGRVYDGTPHDTSQPVIGVTIKVYGSNNPASGEYYGTFLRDTETISEGYWELEVYDDDGPWEFYHLVETDKAGYLSLDATSVGGTKAHNNCISYVIPLDDKTLTGNKFWDRLITTPTATPSKTLTPTASKTPTRTPTGTATPQHSATPSRTATVTATPHPSVTASATATQHASATPSLTPSAVATVTTTPGEQVELVVNTTDDHEDDGCQCLPEGDCTLREAINRANEQAGLPTIRFAIPESDPGYESGVWTIRPAYMLPSLQRDGLTLDGLNEAGPCEPRLAGFGCVAVHPISIDGSGALRAAHGLVLAGANQTVYGLRISNWLGPGILLTAGCHDNVIACNALVANRIGIVVTGAHHNTIGGSLGGNWIADNTLMGVQIVDPGADYNQLYGNLIGTDVTGMALAGSTQIGVMIGAGASYNAIGGAGHDEGNVIAGSAIAEIQIGFDSIYNTIDGNRIGVAADASRVLGPAQTAAWSESVGIWLGGARFTYVGLQAPNIIGGKAIGIYAEGAEHCLIENNAIGSDLGGELNLGNTAHGVHLLRSPEVWLRLNTIAHNGGVGILLEEAATYHCILSENSIWDNGGKGIELKSAANTGLPAPAITSVSPSAVSGATCPGCDVQVYSGPDEEGRFFEAPTVAADASGAWSWTGTLRGDNVTALTIDSADNTSEFTSSGLLFTGGVSQAGASPNSAEGEPVAGVQVGLYGSDDPEALGEWLVSVATEQDGSFSLSYDPSRSRSYAQYTLAVQDPGVEEVTASSDSGGQPTDQGWLVFTGVGPAGDALAYKWTLKFPDNWFQLKTIFELMPDLVVSLVGASPWDDPIPPAEKQEPEDFIIDGIEVTQAIQHFAGYVGSRYAYHGKDSVCATDNCLPLVAGRPALVRVYAGVDKVCPSPMAVGNVTVDLYVIVGAQSIKHSTKFKPICVHRIMPFNNQDPRREYLLGSANFFVTIPSAGTAYFHAEVNKDGGWAETDSTNNRYPDIGNEAVVFKAQRKLDVGYLRLDYHPKPPPTWSGYKPFAGKPTASSYWCASSNAYGQAQDVLPVASFNYYTWGSGLLNYNKHDVRQDSGLELIKELRKQWNVLKAAGTAPDQLVAWLPKGATAGATFDGAADAPAPVWTGEGHTLFYEEGWIEGLAHEIGHNYKLYHAPCPPASFPAGAPANIDKKWPYDDAFIHEVGFSMSKKALVASSSADIMSYCTFRWITPYHWNKLVPELSAVSGSQLAGPRSATIMLVSGRVSEGGGALEDLQLLPGGGEPSAQNPDGTYELVLLNAAGGTLARHRFAVSLQYQDSNEPLAEAGFVEAIEWPGGVYRVRLEREGQAFDERRASLHAPEVTWLEPGPQSYLAGLVWAEWQGTDEDSDGLRYDLYYSANEGATWLPVALGLEETHYAWNAASLPASEVGMLRVVASDGLLSASVTAGLFVVGEQPPQVAIAQPTDREVQDRYQALVLRGSAYDVTEGTLSGTALGWWSDRQGLLGRGETLILPPDTLVPGWHEITLRATDGARLSGEQSLRLFVGDRLYLPLAWRP